MVARAQQASPKAWATSVGARGATLTTRALALAGAGVRLPGEDVSMAVGGGALAAAAEEAREKRGRPNLPRKPRT